MKAAIWTADNRLLITELPEPGRLAGTTRVRVDLCGICGTDLHLYRGELRPEAGSVPGHEIVGTVVESDRFAIGVRAAIEPVTGCGTCGACRGGWPHRCPDLRLLGISAPGGLQEQIVVPDAGVHPVGDTMPNRIAVLAEPLAVAVRAVHLAQPTLGSSALVLGSGTIGLLTLLLLRRVATNVAVTARYPHQRTMAEAFGAARVFEPDSPGLRVWAKSQQPDVVVETVGGHAETITDAIRSVRAGGTVVVLGVFAHRPTIPAFRLVNDEIKMAGSVMYGRAGNHGEFESAVALLPELEQHLARLVDDPFPLSQANEAFDAAGSKSQGGFKVTIAPTS